MIKSYLYLATGNQSIHPSIYLSLSLHHLRLLVVLFRRFWRSTTTDSDFKVTWLIENEEEYEEEEDFETILNINSIRKLVRAFSSPSSSSPLARGNSILQPWLPDYDEMSCTVRTTGRESLAAIMTHSLTHSETGYQTKQLSESQVGLTLFVSFLKGSLRTDQLILLRCTSKSSRDWALKINASSSRDDQKPICFVSSTHRLGGWFTLFQLSENSEQIFIILRDFFGLGGSSIAIDPIRFKSSRVDLEINKYLHSSKIVYNQSFNRSSHSSPLLVLSKERISNFHRILIWNRLLHRIW